MPVNIKVVYITKYNKKFILNKPDNFAYYIKSIMNSNLIDVHLLNPLPLQKNNSIQTLIALVKTIKRYSVSRQPARPQQVGCSKTSRNPKV